MKIAISGGGLSGLVLAITLEKSGIDYHIYESSAEDKRLGAGLLIATNALQIFERLGLAGQIIPKGHTMDFVQITNAQGSVLSRSESKYFEEKYGYGTVAIHRAKLRDLLLTKIPKEKISFDKRITSYKEINDKVYFQFRDGDEDSADYLVGADGLRSNTRKGIMGELKLRYSNQTSWRAIVPYQLPESFKNGLTEMWAKKDGLRASVAHISKDLVYLYITYKHEPFGKDRLEDLKEFLKVVTKDFHPVVNELISVSKDNEIVRTDIFDFEPINEWYKGRVILTGDAAHAMTPNMGQGGCQAIESWYLLGKLIAENKFDMTAAFRKYQEVRKPKVDYVNKLSWKISETVNKNSDSKRGIRDLQMKLTPGFVKKKMLDKIFQLDY